MFVEFSTKEKGGYHWPLQQITLKLICGVVGMTFHKAPIAPSLCNIILIGINKGVVKLPFPSLATSKVKDMPNDIMLWHDKDLIASK